ncbi:MAG TPA: M20/M25/M40 family metallo-hydrolase, partial [Chloroflexota bacterium]|nr:M20/M25/M40 family metallo-hydrolase [Chloroflexota bacterium]
SHPRGRTVETAALFADHLAAEGVSYRIYESPEEGKVNLVARLTSDDPQGKPLLLSSHMDVVQAVAEDWRFMPFSGEVADGYVYGRGTLDDKGMGVMELMTMLLLKRQGIKLSRDVILLCTCDEEIGSPMGAQWLVEHHFDDLDPEFVLDEGGSGYHGFFSAGDTFEISVGEKLILWLKLIARAEPGHASQPWAESATHRLVRAAHTILTEPPESRDTPAVAEMIQRLGGDKARREIAAQRASAPLLHDTISLTMLEGGYKINVIPERAEMSFDCRLLPDTDPRAFVSNVRQLVNDPDIEFEVRWPEAAPATAPWDSALFKALENACLANARGSIVTPSICVGGTDARYFRQRGIPAYGLVPCLFTADDLKGYHGLNERLSVTNLRLGMQIIFDATCEVAALDGARS